MKTPLPSPQILILFFSSSIDKVEKLQILPVELPVNYSKWVESS